MCLILKKAGSGQRAAGSKKSPARLSFLPAACCLLPAILLTGCAVKQPPPLEAVSNAPLVVDDAMQHRQWPLTPVRSANGQTVAWPTATLLVDRDNEPVWQPAVAETPMFMANAVMVPVVYLFTAPWQPVAYPEGEIPASYHAMPPLPPK